MRRLLSTMAIAMAHQMPWVAGSQLSESQRAAGTWNPQSVADLQHACSNADAKAYARFSKGVDRRSDGPIVLRDLFEFEPCEPVPVSEVESAENIVKRSLARIG